jgi:metal-responsive CopG/Arc/MetJ family transcriptional regulator
MTTVAKPVYVRLTATQINYLNKLAKQKSKTLSEIIRDVVQEKIERKSDSNKVNSGMVFSIKTYHLLKQFLHNYHEQSEITVSEADNIAHAVIEAVGHES